MAVGVGCVVHLAGDMITHHGCPLLWPVPIGRRTWRMVTTPAALSVRAGGGFEKAVLLPGLTVAACAAAVWQVPAIQELLFSVTGSLPGRPEAGDG